MDRAEINELRLYANKFIIKFFTLFGIHFQERYQYIIAPCPIHNGDNDNFSWHLDFGVYQCFSRGCHEKFGKDIFGLIMGIKNCNFLEAVGLVRTVAHNDKEVDLKKIVEENSNREFVAKNVEDIPTIYSEDSLSRLVYHNYLETRGYPRELAERYQVGLPKSNYKQMSNRIIFPIRNIDGHIIGFTGRTLLPNWKELGIGKWIHSAGFKKESSLFNIDRARSYIQEYGKAIITEGPLDVLRLEQADIHYGVAIFGRKLHNKQMSILMECGASKLILALDSDIAGQTGIEDAKARACNFFDIETVSFETKDIGELSVEQIRSLFTH